MIYLIVCVWVCVGGWVCANVCADVYSWYDMPLKVRGQFTGVDFLILLKPDLSCFSHTVYS